MKYQVLFIIDSLACGGAEKSLISLLPLLDKERLQIDLLIISRGGAFEKFIPKNVNLIQHNFMDSNSLQKFRRLMFSILLRLNHKCHAAEIYWKSLNKSINPLQKNYDVAIAYQQGVPTFFVADKVKATKKIAWINADVFKAGYDMNWCCQFYKKMDYIIPVSIHLKEKLCNKLPMFKEKYRCVYDVINTELIYSMANADDKDLRYFDSDAFNIVTVGRLVTPKNHLLAVEAAAILNKNGINFKWFFVGDGDMRKEIKQRIQEKDLVNKVFLLGMKENPYPFIKKADIYVQTSTFEGFGLTIAEAKILGRPIVSTNFDVVYDQITDGENGLIAKMTPNSVSSQILKLLNDSNLRNKIASKAENEKNMTAIHEPLKVMRLIYGD